jgi:hypothetical protein
VPVPLKVVVVLLDRFTDVAQSICGNDEEDVLLHTYLPSSSHGLTARERGTA